MWKIRSLALLNILGGCLPTGDRLIVAFETPRQVHPEIPPLFHNLCIHLLPFHCGVGLGRPDRAVNVAPYRVRRDAAWAVLSSPSTNIIEKAAMGIVISRMLRRVMVKCGVKRCKRCKEVSESSEAKVGVSDK